MCIASPYVEEGYSHYPTLRSSKVVNALFWVAQSHPEAYQSVISVSGPGTWLSSDYILLSATNETIHSGWLSRPFHVLKYKSTSPEKSLIRRHVWPWPLRAVHNQQVLSEWGVNNRQTNSIWLKSSLISDWGPLWKSLILNYVKQRYIWAVFNTLV